MQRRLFYSALVIIWCTFIYQATASPAATGESTSSIIEAITKAPEETVQQINFSLRKAGHVTGFGLLAVLLLLAMWGKKQAPVLAWLLATLYGASDEFHQQFVPGRTASLLDVGIDSLGAAGALLIFFWCRRLITTQKKKVPVV